MLLRTFRRNLLRSRPDKLKPVNYAVCIDIECTCDSPVQLHPREIIEIACLKIDLIKERKGDEPLIRAPISQGPSSGKPHPLMDYPKFHSFVKPVFNPELTVFCQQLTGVMQSTVDKAQLVESMTNSLCTWLREQNLIDENLNPKEEFAFASCGNFDLGILAPIMRQCKFRDGLDLPVYFTEWINVKKTFFNHRKEWPKSLYHMLEILGEEPSGRLHSAENDCRNLARIIECLRSDGCVLRITNRA